MFKLFKRWFGYCEWEDGSIEFPTSGLFFELWKTGCGGTSFHSFERCPICGRRVRVKGGWSCF